MPRHPIDQPKPHDSAIRLREFLRILRASLPRPASLTLQRRATEQLPLVQFVRIARGRQV